MKFRQNADKILATTFIVAIGILQCIYWARATSVAMRATIWQEKPYWRSGGAGCFLPWPKEPGMATVMTPMTNPINQLIFYLIRTWLFVAVAIGIVFFFGYLGWCIGSFLKTVKSGGI